MYLCAKAKGTPFSQGLQNDIDIAIAGPDSENRFAPHAVQGFGHHFSMGLDEILELRHISADQSLRATLWKQQGGQFFIEIA